ncbi:MAG: glycosidase [Rariglobus sp.]|nr:glycosidase [Rariglobus sp.]
MSDLARRFSANPLLRPSDIPPSRTGMEVACVLNPGAFRYQGRTGLLLRIAERPVQEPGWISTPVLAPDKEGGIDLVRFPEAECTWIEAARIFAHAGRSYLTTLSHLRLAWSDDGVSFTVDAKPTLTGEGPWESFGIEDCRVTQIGDTYHLHFTAVSDAGFGIGYISTHDWKTFERHGVILPPPNKDFALFPGKIDGNFYALHRPTHHSLGGPYIWISRSPDLLHWGDHHCVARPRPGAWDGLKLGAGAAPIRPPPPTSSPASWATSSSPMAMSSRATSSRYITVPLTR